MRVTCTSLTYAQRPLHPVSAISYIPYTPAKPRHYHSHSLLSNFPPQSISVSPPLSHRRPRSTHVSNASVPGVPRGARLWPVSGSYAASAPAPTCMSAQAPHRIHIKVISPAAQSRRPPRLKIYPPAHNRKIAHMQSSTCTGPHFTILRPRTGLADRTDTTSQLGARAAPRGDVLHTLPGFACIRRSSTKQSLSWRKLKTHPTQLRPIPTLNLLFCPTRVSSGSVFWQQQLAAAAGWAMHPASVSRRLSLFVDRSQIGLWVPSYRLPLADVEAVA